MEILRLMGMPALQISKKVVCKYNQTQISDVIMRRFIVNFLIRCIWRNKACDIFDPCLFYTFSSYSLTVHLSYTLPLACIIPRLVVRHVSRDKFYGFDNLFCDSLIKFVLLVLVVKLNDQLFFSFFFSFVTWTVKSFWICT